MKQTIKKIGLLLVFVSGFTLTVRHHTLNLELTNIYAGLDLYCEEDPQTALNQVETGQYSPQGGGYLNNSNGSNWLSDWINSALNTPGDYAYSLLLSEVTVTAPYIDPVCKVLPEACNQGRSLCDLYPESCKGSPGSTGEDTTTGSNDSNPPVPVCDCAGVPGGSAYRDNCGNCVGGTTGKTPCVQDCKGVWGGKAYTNYCGKCVDGNKGLFDTSSLSSSDNTTFQTTLANYQSTCFGGYLLSRLNQNSGLEISFVYSSSSTGSFSPCQTHMNINPSNINQLFYWTGELFHLYQDQYYTGILSECQNGSRSQGGSNLETEEKLVSLLAGQFSGGYGSYPDFDIAMQWLNLFLKNHPLGSTVSELTVEEKNYWYITVENYRAYWLNQPADLQHLNSQAIDYSLLPNAFLSLWNKLNCK